MVKRPVSRHAERCRRRKGGGGAQVRRRQLRKKGKTKFKDVDGTAVLGWLNAASFLVTQRAAPPPRPPVALDDDESIYSPLRSVLKQPAFEFYERPLER